MSYDISLHDHSEPGNVGIDVGNYTYNCAPMFNMAFGVKKGWTDLLERKKCKDVLPIIRKALAHMATNPKDYILLNPKNGWGSYTGATEFIQRLFEQAEKYPEHIIYIH
jgi:hypothetical protein